MNRVFALLLGLSIGIVSAGAQSPEEEYVRIYNLIQQADALQTAGQSDEALPKYLEANTALLRIKRFNPVWQPKVVSYRLNYLAEKIAAIPGAKPVSPQTTAPPAVSSGPTPPVPPPGTAPAPQSTEVQQQMAALQESVRRLQSEKTILESKLKEALATQPAAIDPRELTKAQDKVQSLLKENELLKAGLEQEKARPASLNARELEEARRALAEANTKLAEQVAVASKLAVEKGALQDQVGSLTASAAAADVLRTENTLLKKQLAETKTVAATASVVPEAARKLAEAEAQLATMRSDTEVLRLEKIALESRLKKVLATPALKSATVSREADLERIRQLEQERDDYLKKLEAANRDLSNGQNRDYASKVEQLTREVANLKSRVEVFEARAIPYTAEELALFKPSAPTLAPAGDANKVPGRKSVKDQPPGTVALVAQAQKHFAAKDYAKAEENYLEILRQDASNADTHANLGAIQLEMGRLDEAEKHIQQALAAAPDDAYAISLLGYLRLQQDKYDEAIVALNRAAKLNPKNADIQNHLGVTLTQKGLRGPAEQAFRKAVVLSPGHAGAHHNLAVFYAAENPPNVPLARFHYQKALAAGHPKNPDVEKLFEKKAAANP
jgi:tetratricopeptide (TPR) repeat protein